MRALTILAAATATGTGSPVPLPDDAKSQTYQVTVRGTGTVGANVPILVSNDNVAYIPLGTATLAGTGTASDGMSCAVPWLFVRAVVAAINGTGAAVDVTAGV